MCVIFIINGTRPTEEQVEKAYDANSAGAGVAWRERDPDGTPLVKWKKGLNMAQIQELCATIPMPYIAHFRIPSCGGISDELCHPFPITPDVPLTLEGETTGFVLFHNGHWGLWRDTLLKSAVNNHLQVPHGKWSDSRAMAWLAAHHSLGILDFIDEKTVAFGPGDGDCEVTQGGGWKLIKDQGKELFWASNDHWTFNYTRVNRRALLLEDDKDKDGVCLSPWVTPPASMMPNDIETTKRKSGGASAVDSFRDSGEVEGGGSDFQKAVQKSQASLERRHREREGQQKVSTALVRVIPPSKEELEQFKWARGLNPKRLRSGNVDLERRREDAAKGISHVPLL